MNGNFSKMLKSSKILCPDCNFLVRDSFFINSWILKNPELILYTDFFFVKLHHLMSDGKRNYPFVRCNPFLYIYIRLIKIMNCQIMLKSSLKKKEFLETE